MSSCSSWLLHAVLDKRKVYLNIWKLFFFMDRHLSHYNINVSISGSKRARLASSQLTDHAAFKDSRK